DPFVRGVGWTLLLSAICIGCRAVLSAASGGTILGSGGLVGAWGNAMLEQHFSTGGTALLLLTGFVVGMLLTTDALLFRVVGLAFVAPYLLFRRLSFGRSAAAAEPVSPEPLRVR